MKSLFILGKHPNLALAELTALYGSDAIIESDQTSATVNIEPEDIDFNRIGGSIKLARVIGYVEGDGFDNVVMKLTKIIPEIAQKLDQGKLKIGFSVYGIRVNPRVIEKLARNIKKEIVKNERSIRFIVNKENLLNSASVIHNRLLSTLGMEIIILKKDKGFIIAKTVRVQNIEAYSKRDHARPNRDSKVGMLPPKLAQIIINLASIDQAFAKSNSILLDPFCGTGVILQEANLMGFRVIGTDHNQRMIDYSKANLKWLHSKLKLTQDEYTLMRGDAQDFQWPKFDVLASETYLGKPFANPPGRDELNKEMHYVNRLLTNFLNNLKNQIDKKVNICIAIPAWRIDNTIHYLSLVDQIEDMGYNFIDLKNINSKSLYYSRTNQVVLRQLILIRKK